ncbi:hypothetical protein PYJP_14660 [Pyrofollis japonicus]|nr:hypothetical protein PYJP_14660 [Pyrofollis japonicus]
MLSAKREARLLFIHNCESLQRNDNVVALVFRGPFRVEYILIGGSEDEVISEISRQSVFKEIRLIWPPRLASRTCLTPVEIDAYFSKCKECISVFLESICTLTDKLKNYKDSL